MLGASDRAVRVHTVTEADQSPWEIAITASRARLAPWNPSGPGMVSVHLARQSEALRTFLIRAHKGMGGHDVVGSVHISVDPGAPWGALLSYDAYDPYAQRRLFSAGFRLVLGLAFASNEGLGLSRLAANVAPANERSTALLLSTGFRLILRQESAPRRRINEDHYVLDAEDWSAGSKLT